MDRCQGWSSWSVEISTIDSTSRACCEVGAVSIVMEGNNSNKVNILVVCEKPLGYDLLIRIDMIQALGGIVIMLAGGLQLDITKVVRSSLC